MQNTKAYLNGRIYTVDINDADDWSLNPKEALVTDSAKIKFVGSNVDAKSFVTSDTEVIDLKGATVLPGIHDVHMHPLEAGSPVGGTVELPADTSPEKMIKIIKQAARRQIGTNWVLGHGYSLKSMLSHIAKGGRPPKAILDEALPDRPAVMMEETSHSVWVNSKALTLAGIYKDSSPIPAGIVMKDSKSGEPNGILLENAGNFMIDLAMQPTAELEELNYKGLLWSLKKLSENGITSVCDARSYWRSNHHKAWQKALANDKMNVRAILGMWAYPHVDDDRQLEELKRCYRNDRDSLLRIIQTKMYSDGIIESTTAAVLEPYLIDYHFEGINDNKGMNYFNETRMTKYIKELQNMGNDEGFDFHIHTIGDRAVHESLNAIENANSSQNLNRLHRHRLTHLEMVSPSDIPRFSKLGVIADFQVAGDFALPAQRDDNVELIGATKARNTIPLRDLWKSGAKTTLSSDWDVSDLSPFVGIQHAIQREHQSVDVKHAVEMYTINGAYVMRQEDKVGSLVAGKEADFIVVDKDIFNIAIKKISQTAVLQTIFKGDVVFKRSRVRKPLDR